MKKGKRLDIVIGLPASGKSSAIVNPLSEYYQSMVIDSDIIKQRLPEYQGGWGSSLVHEESSLINAELLDASMADGNNIVLPIVGSKASSVEKYIAQAKRYGYSVNLHLNELPGGKAVGRLLKRYFDTGRFIDPTFVAGYGNKPTEVFEQLKNRGDIDGYSRWDNDVEYGQRPRIRDSRENERLFVARYGESGQGGRQLFGRTPETANPTTDSENLIAPIKEASSKDGVFFDAKNGAKYSISDSNGKQLSKGQQDYFKDSKVRFVVDSGGSLDIFVQTMFVHKNKGSIANMSNAKALNSTPAATVGTAPDATVTQDSEIVNGQFSISDSNGKQLSKGQQDYFKYSKVRDDNGNLKVMYHGTPHGGFHTFQSRFSDDKTSLFFTDSPEVASSYSGSSEIYTAKTLKTTEDFRNFLREIPYH